MRWSASLFFFLILAFIIYVFASGDDKEWRLIFTKAGYQVDPNVAGGMRVNAPIATEASTTTPPSPLAAFGLSQEEQVLFGNMQLGGF